MDDLNSLLADILLPDLLPSTPNKITPQEALLRAVDDVYMTNQIQIQNASNVVVKGKRKSFNNNKQKQIYILNLPFGGQPQIVCLSLFELESKQDPATILQYAPRLFEYNDIAATIVPDDSCLMSSKPIIQKLTKLWPKKMTESIDSNIFQSTNFFDSIKYYNAGTTYADQYQRLYTLVESMLTAMPNNFATIVKNYQLCACIISLCAILPAYLSLNADTLLTLISDVYSNSCQIGTEGAPGALTEPLIHLGYAITQQGNVDFNQVVAFFVTVLDAFEKGLAHNSVLETSFEILTQFLKAFLPFVLDRDTDFPTVLPDKKVKTESIKSFGIGNLIPNLSETQFEALLKVLNQETKCNNKTNLFNQIKLITKAQKEIAVQFKTFEKQFTELKNLRPDLLKTKFRTSLHRTYVPNFIKYLDALSDIADLDEAKITKADFEMILCDSIQFNDKYKNLEPKIKNYVDAKKKFNMSNELEKKIVYACTLGIINTLKYSVGTTSTIFGVDVANVDANLDITAIPRDKMKKYYGAGVNEKEFVRILRAANTITLDFDAKGNPMYKHNALSFSTQNELVKNFEKIIGINNLKPVVCLKCLQLLKKKIEEAKAIRTKESNALKYTPTGKGGTEVTGSGALKTLKKTKLAYKNAISRLQPTITKILAQVKAFRAYNKIIDDDVPGKYQSLQTSIKSSIP